MRERSCNSSQNITVSLTARGEGERKRRKAGAGALEECLGICPRMSLLIQSGPTVKCLPVLTVLLMKWKGVEALLIMSNLLKVISL